MAHGDVFDKQHGSPLATTSAPVAETQPISSPERPGA